jgi:hypothetical protein
VGKPCLASVEKAALGDRNSWYHGGVQVVSVTSGGEVGKETCTKVHCRLFSKPIEALSS